MDQQGNITPDRSAGSTVLTSQKYSFIHTIILENKELSILKERVANFNNSTDSESTEYGDYYGVPIEVRSKPFSAPEDEDIKWIFTIVLPAQTRAHLSLSSNKHRHAVYMHAELFVGGNNGDIEGREVQISDMMLMPDSDLEYDLLIPAAMSKTGIATLVVKVTYIKFGQKLTRLPALSAYALPTNMRTLLNDSQHSDFTLVCNQRTWHVNKCILAARSPYFAGMFSSKLSEDESGLLELKDVSDADAFGAMIEYIYTDQVSNLEDHAVTLLGLSDRFYLLGLKSLCENELSSKLHKYNAADFLILADQLNAKLLYESALKIVCAHLHDICDSEDWETDLSCNPRIMKDVIRFSCKKT